MSEKAPEMSAWEAMMAAAVASPTIGKKRPGRRQKEKGLFRGGAVDQQQRALTEVVEQEGGQDQREPRQTNRPLSEVAHIGVQRLAAGDRQKHRAQHREAVQPVRLEEDEGVDRVDRGEDDRLPDDPGHTEGRDRDEPQHHHRTKQPADQMRAVLLDREDPDQNRHGDRHDVRIEQRRGDLQSLDGAEHGNRRRDHAVAIEQRRAENAERDQHVLPFRCRVGTSAVSARMPPSPALSARITMAMYLIEMTITSA